MPNFLFFLLGAMGVVAVALIVQLLLPNPMHLEFPVNTKYAERSLEIFEKIRIDSSIEQFPVSYEVIDNRNLQNYVNVLKGQFDKPISDYIERIPYTKQGQYFLRSVTMGKSNKFSITLIAHKQYEGYHKILIAEISKEVTITLLSRMLLSFKTIIGWASSDQQGLEQIMTNLDSEKNKEIMQNLMMLIMAKNLQQRYANDLSISFISTN